MAARQDLLAKAADILVVDDAIDSLRLLSEILTNAGYQVRPAERPQMALESALAHPPSLILLDVKMPEMSGFEVCRRLKQDERTRDIPIIFVSALQELQDRIHGFEVGGVDFISKPIQEREVLARVKTHLQLRYMQLHLEELVAERTAELRRSVEALRESEEKFRTLVTNTEQIVYMIAKDGTFLLSEGKGLATLGLKPGEVVGKSVFELYEDYPDMLDAMRKVFNGETAIIEVNVGGNHFSNWYTPHRDQEGEIIGLMGLSVNISERKRAEEVLEAELAYHREDLSVLVQRHSLAVKISSLGIWEWDIEENLMIWDNTLFEIYGIEKKIPLPYEEYVRLIHPDDLPTVEATMRTVIESKSEAILEFRIVRPDGKLRHISAAGTVVLNDAGEVVKAIGINQDISERKRLEAREQEAAVLEERERLARELHDAVTQTLFSASMIAEAAPALWDNDPAVGREYLQQLPWMLRGALAEMRTLLMELRPYALRDQTLGQLLEPLTDSIRVRSGGANVVLKVEGDRSLPDDVTLALYRIVQESLNNIARHAKASKITVWLRCDQAGVKLHISDNGRGFDPRSIPPGHLGVGIMKDRAGQVGAIFRIDSEPGQGTMVIISWLDQPLSIQ